MRTLEKLKTKITEALDRAKKQVNFFKVDLDRNPWWAMETADTTFKNAARVRIYTEALQYIREIEETVKTGVRAADTDIIATLEDVLTQEVIKMARYSDGKSNSQSLNLMQIYYISVQSALIDDLKMWSL